MSRRIDKHYKISYNINMKHEHIKYFNMNKPSPCILINFLSEKTSCQYEEYVTCDKCYAYYKERFQRLCK